MSLKAEPHKTYIEIASAGNCRNNYSKKKKLIWLQTRIEPAQKTSGRPLGNPWRGCCLGAIFKNCIGAFIDHCQRYFVYIVGFFHSRKSNTINVDKHKDQHDLQQITNGFYRFFTILSWYSKVRDSESLLFQLAVNRD